MALPWLIGGAIVGGIALASKLSGGSNNDDYDDDDREDEIRRRAEKDRKRRSLTERLDNISSEVEQEGARRASIFQTQLNDSLQIEYSAYQAYAATLDSRGNLNENDDLLEEYINFDEDLLPSETQENLDALISFYNVDSINLSNDFQSIIQSQEASKEMLIKLADRLNDLLSLHESITESDEGFDHLESHWNRIEKFQDDGFSFISESDDIFDLELSNEAKELQEALAQLTQTLKSIRD